MSIYMIGNIVMAVAVFALGYFIRPIVDEVRDMEEMEESLKNYVNEGRERHR